MTLTLNCYSPTQEIYGNKRAYNTSNDHGTTKNERLEFDESMANYRIWETPPFDTTDT